MFDGNPEGKQNARGSSWRGSPVRGSRNVSPPGLSGAIKVWSKFVFSPLPLARGFCHIPLKSGLPSAVRRGIFVFDTAVEVWPAAADGNQNTEPKTNAVFVKRMTGNRIRFFIGTSLWLPRSGVNIR